MPQRVRTVFQGVQGSPWLNTLFFFGSDQASASAANLAVGAFWGALDANMPSAVTWATDPEVTQIDENTGEPTASWPVTPQTGTGAGSLGNMLPTAAQGLIRLRTGFFIGGREVRGRVFIPGMQEANSDSGQPNTAVRASWQSAIDALIGALGVDLAVYSRRHRVLKAVTSASTSGSWAILTGRRD